MHTHSCSSTGGFIELRIFLLLASTSIFYCTRERPLVLSSQYCCVKCMYASHSPATKWLCHNEISRPNELTLYEFRALRLIIRSLRVCGIHEKHRNKVFYYNVDNIDGIARARFVFVLCVCEYQCLYIHMVCKRITYLHRCMEKC